MVQIVYALGTERSVAPVALGYGIYEPVADLVPSRAIASCKRISIRMRCGGLRRVGAYQGRVAVGEDATGSWHELTVLGYL